MPVKKSAETKSAVQKNTDSSIFQRLFNGVSLSDTLFLAAIPIVAYLIVYFYELGYFSIFDIPIEFASFDLARIFLAILYLLVFIFFIYWINDILQGIINSQPEPIKRRLQSNVLSFILILVYLFFTVHDWKIWLEILLGFLLLISLQFWIPLFTQRDKKGYIAKLSAVDEINDQNKNKREKTPSIIDRLSVLIGPRILLFIIILAGTLYVSYLIGRTNAVTQSNFFVLNTSPERAVLWTFNDHIIASTFDRNSKQLNPGFIILDLGKDSNLEYRAEQIGPLTMKSLASIPSVTPTPTILVPSNSITPSP